MAVLGQAIDNAKEEEQNKDTEEGPQVIDSRMMMTMSNDVIYVPPFSTDESILAVDIDRLRLQWIAQWVLERNQESIPPVHTWGGRLSNDPIICIDYTAIWEYLNACLCTTGFGQLNDWHNFKMINVAADDQPWLHWTWTQFRLFELFSYLKLVNVPSSFTYLFRHMPTNITEVQPSNAALRFFGIPQTAQHRAISANWKITELPNLLPNRLKRNGRWSERNRTNVCFGN